jgi:hypothetical protein
MIGHIVIILIGGVVLFMLGRDILRGLSSRNWPTAEGRITFSSMDVRQSSDEDGTSTTYGAAVVYSYNVFGQEFQGARRTFTDVRTSSAKRTQRILERYPQGSSVTVYYHPEKPSLSVLEPGVGWFSYVGAIFVLGLLVVGIRGVLGVIG